VPENAKTQNGSGKTRNGRGRQAWPMDGGAFFFLQFLCCFCTSLNNLKHNQFNRGGRLQEEEDRSPKPGVVVDALS